MRFFLSKILMDQRLVIFIKAPVAGKVKTRLVPPLTFEHAAKIYSGWAIDLYKSVSSLKFLKVQIAYQAHPDFPTPEWLNFNFSQGSCHSSWRLCPDVKSGFKMNEDRKRKMSQKIFFGGLQEKISFFLQKGENLGERLTHAFNHTFKEGAKAAAIIGSDSPGLPLAYIKEAFHALNKSDLVLGPSLDGGYYLVALKDGVETLEVFKNVTWSSSNVLKETKENAKKLNLKVHLLPEYFDIDEPNDLQFLNSL